MRVECEGMQLHLQMQGNEQLSALITGRSGMGKTFLASCLGRELIDKGESVYLIDLGDKWSRADKERLISAGAVFHSVEKEGITLLFRENAEVCKCSRIIANALGFRSANAVMVLKNAFKRLLFVCGQEFSIGELRDYLQAAVEAAPEESEWKLKVYDRLDSCDELSQVRFKVDVEMEFSPDSAIWDFSGMDDTFVQLSAYLISFCLLCRQKLRFRLGITGNRSFLIIDEFQTLDCDRKSVIGTCLTEGRKYGLALILLTQFLHGNFSDAVISQFEQGGFRFYFRLTEEEAAIVSRELVGNSQERSVLYQKLVQIPQGHCLMIGRHRVGNKDMVTEAYRFVEIKDEWQA